MAQKATQGKRDTNKKFDRGNRFDFFRREREPQKQAGKPEKPVKE
jgi:hypothetical protein